MLEEELPVIAEEGESVWGAVVLAVAAAEHDPPAGTALLWQTAGPLDEAQFLPLLLHLREGVRQDIAQPPPVQGVEVAGVDAAVVFDDEVGAAGGSHGAEGGLSRDQAVEDGVEEADGDGLGVVGIPGVEEPAEEFAPF